MPPDRSLILWKLSRSEHNLGLPQKRLLGHNHFVSDIAISTDGHFALSGSWDRSLRLWDLGQGTSTRQFVDHKKDVMSVAFSADNRQIVSGSRDKSLKLWNTLAHCKFTMQHWFLLNWHLFSSHGLALSMAAVSGGRSLTLGSELAVVRGLIMWQDVLLLVRTQPGRYNLAPTSYPPNCTKRLLDPHSFWSVRHCRATFTDLQEQGDEGHADWVSCVRFSPNIQNPIIVSCGWDKKVKTKTETPFPSTMLIPSPSLLTSPRVWPLIKACGVEVFRTLVGNLVKDTLLVWSLTNCKVRTDHSGHSGYLNSVTISPDGSLCASGGKCFSPWTQEVWCVNSCGPMRFSASAPGPKRFSASAPVPERFSASAPVPERFSASAPGPERFSASAAGPKRFSA
uniref:Small ribosomal subunit protein RACK1 n=1 Tax=Timema douglasi TaxID=61478 RepID=A0A7R8VIB4_TIMDO|nr:unnamed protein product [Timema douglasi]